MNFLSTTYMAPSGSFTQIQDAEEDLGCSGIYRPIYNPAVLDRYTSSFEVAKTIPYQSDEWFSALSKFPCRVAESEFDCYAGKLVELTEHTLEASPNCLLAPLRGAAKPCAIAEVMSRGQVLYDYFNFQAGSDTRNQPRIKNELITILRQRDPGTSTFRINITDTARGGQGINALVSMIRDIREADAQFNNQQWILDLNLFHDLSSHTNIDNIEAVRRRFSLPGKIAINVNRYPVDSLIVEDYDPALAVKLEADGKVFRFKPCAVAGSFLYRTGNEVRIIESQDCYQTFEKLYSDSLTQFLLTSPKHEQDGVVWQDYQQK